MLIIQTITTYLMQYLILVVMITFSLNIDYLAIQNKWPSSNLLSNLLSSFRSYLRGLTIYCLVLCDGSLSCSLFLLDISSILLAFTTLAFLFSKYLRRSPSTFLFISTVRFSSMSSSANCGNCFDTISCNSLQADSFCWTFQLIQQNCPVK